MNTLLTIESLSTTDILDIIRISVLLLTLIYASYLDIKYREIEPNVWYPAIIVGIVVFMIEAHLGDEFLVILSLLLSIALVGGIAKILYELRLFYGADYKALFVISLVIYSQPSIGPFPIFDLSTVTNMQDVLTASGFANFFSELGVYIAVILFGYTVIVNTTLFASSYLFGNLITNIKNGDFNIKKPLRAVGVRRVKSDTVLQRYCSIIQPTESNNPIIRGFQFIKNGISGDSAEFYRDYLKWYKDTQTVSRDVEMSDIDSINLEQFVKDTDWDSTNIDADKERLENNLDKEYVWITPGTPFIVSITLGFVTAILFGNLVYIGMYFLF